MLIEFFCLLYFLSVFYLLYFLTWILIHFNCSLDELQVNYNNDRSRWFNQFLCFCFYSLDNLLFDILFTTLLLTSFHLSQRLHKPKSTNRAERKTFTSIFCLVLYLSVYESSLLIFLKSILIYICFSLSSVKQPGYGDAGNMYAAQGSGGRAGAKYFKLLLLVWFICHNVLFF